jgi:hypothetical protein
MYTAHYQGTAQVAVIAGLALLYFLPASIAWINRRKNATAITLLNLFLGWTFVGWVLPLVLACIPDGHMLQASLPPPQPSVCLPSSTDTGENAIRTAPAVARMEDAFIVRGRLMLEEGPEAT